MAKQTDGGVPTSPTRHAPHSVQTRKPRTSVPARGTRPRDRRSHILAAAADLFYESGYAQVAMSDIAAAVNVSPSALYRHFSSKEEVLVGSVWSGIAPFAEAIAANQHADLESLLARGAVVADQYRRVGALWQRDLRHMPLESRDELAATLRSLGAGVSAFVQRQRPDLTADVVDVLGWTTLSTLNSISFHRLSLPGSQLSRLLTVLALRVAGTPVPPQVKRSIRAVPAGLEVTSRRERVLRESIEMFGRHGFHAVRMEDIGARVGITGPSLYNHVGSKDELLLSAVSRGIDSLWIDLHRVFASAEGSAEALDALIDSLVTFVSNQPQLAAVLTHEEVYLPQVSRDAVRRSQSDYVAEWAQLVPRSDEIDSPAAAQIAVRAFLSILIDVARNPHLPVTSTIQPLLKAIGRQVLA